MYLLGETVRSTKRFCRLTVSNRLPFALAESNLIYLEAVSNCQLCLIFASEGKRPCLVQCSFSWTSILIIPNDVSIVSMAFLYHYAQRGSLLIIVGVLH
jgi:hypothetical protein